VAEEGVGELADGDQSAAGMRLVDIDGTHKKAPVVECEHNVPWTNGRISPYYLRQVPALGGSFRMHPMPPFGRRLCESRFMKKSMQRARAAITRNQAKYYDREHLIDQRLAPRRK